MNYWRANGRHRPPSGIPPVVADGMNRAEKIVFSRALKKAEWNNTKLLEDNILDRIAAMKRGSGKNMAILDSGSIVSQFTAHNLIGEYQVMLDSVASPGGTPLFNGITQKLDLELKGIKTFRSGVVLLTCRPRK